MELKENMYIRTKRGIRKIEQIDEDKILVDKGCFFYYENEIIGKPSFNITDLIEVGDFVNEKQVYSKSIGEGYWYLYGGHHDIIACKDDYLNKIKNIEDVVTYEQFCNMKYGVK